MDNVLYDTIEADSFKEVVTLLSSEYAGWTPVGSPTIFENKVHLLISYFDK